MKRRTFRKKMELLGGRIALSIVLRLSKHLNPKRIESWGNRLGNFAYAASRRYRTVTLKNLSMAFPDWSEDEVCRIARNTFKNFARSGLEFFYLLSLPSDELDRWIAVDGKEHLDGALESGRGAVVITAHLGNWEFFARKLVLLGYSVNVIARDSDDPTMTGVVNSAREGAGYRVLSRDNSALPALRALRKNQLVGILPDQNTFTGVFVEFFGRLAATATGPAVLSLKTGAPVVCGFCRRDEKGSFVATIYPPIEVSSTGDEDADVRNLTAEITKAIENEIRKDPAQWLWLHDRWKRASESPDYAMVKETDS